MSEVLRTKIILLKKTKYSESDLVLQGITPAGERISMLAKGALKSKKRFGGGILEPTHQIEIQIKKPKQESGLYILEEAVLVNGFEGIRTSYDKIEFALYLVDIISRISQEGDSYSDSLYNLLGHTLTAVEKTEDLHRLKMHFGLKLLYSQGVLDQEAWMGPYLALPLARHSELNDRVSEAEQSGGSLDKRDPIFDNNLRWLEVQILRYLETAEH